MDLIKAMFHGVHPCLLVQYRHFVFARDYFLLISNIFYENIIHPWDSVIFVLFDFQAYLLHKNTSYKNSSLSQIPQAYRQK